MAQRRPRERELAALQREMLLAFIRLYSKQEGVAPTYREMAAGCHYRSNCTLDIDLKKLAASGAIELRRGRKRATRILAA